MNNWIIIVIILVGLFLFLMIFGLLLLKKSDPMLSLEEDLEIWRIHLNESDLEYLVGKNGVTVMDLTPYGMCDIDGIEFEVKAEAGSILKGRKVCVIRIHGNRIMVREND